MKLERVKTEAAFEPALRPLYTLMAISAVCGGLLMWAMGFTITRSALSLAILPAYIVFGGMMARRIGQRKLAAGLECGALIYQQGLVTLLILFPLAALSGPYADNLLDSWDRALGLDWPAYLEACRPITRELVFAYRSFNWQPILLVAGLIYFGQEKRLFQLVTAAFIGGIIIFLVFPFFPAQAPMTHYGITPADFPELGHGGPWRFLSVLEGLRHGDRVVSLSMFTGMVAFPSYHSVIAIQFLWAGWGIPRLRWFFVAMNLAMLAAIPVAGNHYFVDVFAGAGVGIAAIWIAGRLRGSHPSPAGRNRLCSREPKRTASSRATRRPSRIA